MRVMRVIRVMNADIHGTKWNPTIFLSSLGLVTLIRLAENQDDRTMI